MNKLLKISLISLAVILLLISAAFLYYQNSIRAEIVLDGNKIFIVNKGEGVKTISLKAQELGLIRSAKLFELYLKFSDLSGSLKAGQYQLTGPISPVSLADILIAGNKTDNTKNITIPEGWSIRDIDAYLAKEGIIAAGDYERKVKDSAYVQDQQKKYDFLNGLPANASLEGYLFPDTYSIFANATADDIIKKQLDNFDLKINPQLREAAVAKGKNLNDMVIMASIIQKEVRKEEDMKMVSDIFWRRIENRQGLESCATLAYILGVNKPQYSLEDTKVDSPYNTYRNRGLTPGPISNPGLAAIEAAINPSPNEYNFFLTANGTGETIYSRTFEEHVANKNKYLK